jgi:hypothetical protein
VAGESNTHGSPGLLDCLDSARLQPPAGPNLSESRPPQDSRQGNETQDLAASPAGPVLLAASPKRKRPGGRHRAAAVTLRL